MRPASLLKTRLHDAVVLVCRLNQSLAFLDCVRNRFLQVNVLAGLASQNADDRMPVIRRSNDDRIDRGIVEDSTEVLMPEGSRLLVLGDGFSGSRFQRRVHVTQRGNFCTGHLSQPFGQVLALIPHADDPDSNRVSLIRHGGRRRKRNHSGGRPGCIPGTVAKKLPTAEIAGMGRAGFHLRLGGAWGKASRVPHRHAVCLLHRPIGSARQKPNSKPLYSNSFLSGSSSSGTSDPSDLS